MSKTVKLTNSDEALAQLDAAWAYYSPSPPVTVLPVRNVPEYWSDPGRK